MKIGIVCSPGGHLTQALSLIETFKGNEVFLIIQEFQTVKGIHIEEVRNIYYLRIYLNYSLWLGVLISFFASFFSIFRIFIKERPSILFSTGSEIAIPAFIIGKLLFGSKLIFLESLARIRDLSLTGKILYPITDLFLVQWEEILRKYQKRKMFYRGKVI